MLAVWLQQTHKNSLQVWMFLMLTYYMNVNNFLHLEKEWSLKWYLKVFFWVFKLSGVSQTASFIPLPTGRVNFFESISQKSPKLCVWAKVIPRWKKCTACWQFFMFETSPVLIKTAQSSTGHWPGIFKSRKWLLSLN